MIDLLIVILVLSWLGGESFHVGGDLIHLLLVLALVMLVLRILRSGRD